MRAGRSAPKTPISEFVVPRSMPNNAIQAPPRYNTRNNSIYDPRRKFRPLAETTPRTSGKLAPMKITLALMAILFSVGPALAQADVEAHAGKPACAEQQIKIDGARAIA